MTPVKPKLGGITFAEYQTAEGRDRATLRALAQKMRSGGIETPAGFVPALERHLSGYPIPPPHRDASRLRYWITALYWLLHDDGDTLAANRVASWCRDNGIVRQAQSIIRAARTEQGRAAGERIRRSVKLSDVCFDHESVVAAHGVAIKERILAWHKKDDTFGIVRKFPVTGG